MVEKTKITSTKMGVSKDTLNIKKIDLTILPLKSCIQICNPDGSGEKLNVRKAKTVHFADSLGKPLRSVKTLCDMEDDLDRMFLGLSTISGNSSKKRRNFSTSNSNEFKNISNDKCRFVNFTPPITEFKFLDKVLQNNVLLENVIFRDDGIFGTVNVKNVSFEKDVSITYTLNGWKSIQKTVAKYVPGSSTGTIDIFSFEINVTDFGLKECKIEFAICYVTSNETFWDSNLGKNYIINFGMVSSTEKKLIGKSDNYNGFIIPKQNFIGWAS